MRNWALFLLSLVLASAAVEAFQLKEQGHGHHRHHGHGRRRPHQNGQVSLVEKDAAADANADADSDADTRHHHHHHHHRLRGHHHRSREAELRLLSQLDSCWNGTAPGSAGEYELRDAACGETIKNGGKAVKVPSAFVVKQIEQDDTEVADCAAVPTATTWKKVRYMQYEGYVPLTKLSPSECIVGQTGDYSDARGVDVSTLCGGWKCLFDKHNYSFAIPRIYRESNGGSVDQNGGLSAQQAAREGFFVDAYMYVAGKQVSAGERQARDVIAAIRDLPIYRIWIDIEGVGTSWTAGSTPDLKNANRQLLQDIITTFQAASINIGVYSQDHVWNDLFGSDFTAAKDAGAPVWWATYGSSTPKTTELDGACQFGGTPMDLTQNWRDFGGYTSGDMKQYNGNCQVCGCVTDTNIRGSWPPAGGAGGGAANPSAEALSSSALPNGGGDGGDSSEDETDTPAPTPNPDGKTDDGTPVPYEPTEI